MNYMKIANIQLVSIVLAVFLMTTSCDEVPIVITPAQTAGECTPAAISTVVDQKKQVLIEEFTGVRCVNCPAGSEALQQLLDRYGERLIAFSIHAGFFSDPYTQSLYDFRTPAAEAILNFHNSPPGYPSAIVDRKIFGGAIRPHLGQSLWADAIAQQLEEEPEVKIHLDPSFDPITSDFELRTTIFYEQAIEEEVRITVLITEDKVTDYQLTPSGLQADYVHDHVIRSSLSAPAGNILTEPSDAGSIFCKLYTGNISADWKEEDCKAIVFLHKGGESREVLQAHQVKIIQ